MANALNPLSRSKIVGQTLDWTSGTWRLQFVDGTFTGGAFAAAEFLADVPGGALVGTPEAIGGRVVLADGILDADDVSPGPTVANGDTVAALIVYHDTGSAATSELLYFADTNEDTTPISRVGTGAPIAVVWSNLADRIAKL